MTNYMSPTLAELGAKAQDSSSPLSVNEDLAFIVCDGLVRIFKSENIEVVALQGLDLRVQRGEIVAIVGASGSGKSTLLRILSGLDVPTAGKVQVAGHDLLTMGYKERLEYRRHAVGFVYQQTSANLLPYLTAAQNIETPLRATGKLLGSRRERQTRARELLDIVGLSHLEHRLPSELSGGQQQRVAIAVALANNPAVILADEPTGELDSASASEVFDTFAQINQQLGVTIVIVTHDEEVSSRVERTVTIRDGRTSTETIRSPQLSIDLGAGQSISEGTSAATAREYAVLDRTGRLQLPADMVTALDLAGRVRLELAGDHVQIWPDHSEAIK